jgi:hypothetical protein
MIEKVDENGKVESLPLLSIEDHVSHEINWDKIKS